jgi:Protein of unknown function (DUF3667)
MKNYCRNCHHPLPYKAKFCPHCAQKNSDGKVPLRELGNQLFFKIFHLESRYFRVLWRLLIPGQVSVDYFTGKHKRYPPPVQFFFVMVFFFLFLLNHQPDKDGNRQNLRVRTGNSGAAVRFEDDSIADRKNQPVKDLYAQMVRAAEVTLLKRDIDSLPKQYQTPLVRAAIDSLLRKNYADVYRKLDTISISLIFTSVDIAMTDVFLLPYETLCERYHLTSWGDKLMLRQGIKALKDPEGLKHSLIGAFGWLIFTIAAVMAGWLSLLYWRSKRFYVEHFIFLLHQHSMILLWLSIAFSVNILFDLPAGLWAAVIIWIILSDLLAIRRFYRQSWSKSAVKWLLYSFLNAVSGIFLFGIGILIVTFFLF